jgi:hypothetical protein
MVETEDDVVKGDSGKLKGTRKSRHPGTEPPAGNFKRSVNDADGGTEK